MNISSDYEKDFPVPDKPSGAYEWWYFDARTHDNEWGIVIIFYQGNPFSPEYIRQIKSQNSKPDEFPAISISLYHKNRTEYYSFIEYHSRDFNWNKESDTFNIGPCSFQQKVEDNRLTYLLKLDQNLDSGHAIKADLTFRSIINSSIFQDEQSNPKDDHFWNLVQPAAEVEGDIKISGKSKNESFQFKGMGYHDHNIGNEPMRDSFQDWYWGRFHFQEYTLVYYAMNGFDFKQHKAWLLKNDTQHIVETFSDFNSKSIERSFFGITSARNLFFNSERIKVAIDQKVVLDNGPFYQRFKSNVRINYGDKEFFSEGFSEYIKPSRIYWKIFWPAVNMRLRFKRRKAHWVQNFKNLYEWTW